MDFAAKDFIRLTGRETRFLKKRDLDEGKAALASQSGDTIHVWGASFDRRFLSDTLWRLEKMLGKGLRGLVLE